MALTDYQNRPGYQLDMQRRNAQNVHKPVNTGAADIEAAHVQGQMQRHLEQGSLGLEKHMFETSHEEQKRQFDVSGARRDKETKWQQQFWTDKFKATRRQNNRAELLGMANVGLSIGMGFQQYLSNQKQIRLMKLQEASYRRKVG